jgi:ribosome-associated toxin RatA of RatAB toxin-antitoxin module
VRSTIEIDVAAPAELVFRITRDVTRWPELLPHYVSVRLAGPPGRDGVLVARMTARRPVSGLLGWGIPVTWQARAWSKADDLRLRFVHVAGATKGMDVTWRIEPTAEGCHVAITHDFRPAWPLLAIVVDRWLTRPIAGRTLATFKALAEALAESLAGPSPAAGKSDPPESTIPPP